MLVDKDKDLGRIHDLISNINKCADELHSWTEFMVRTRNEYKEGKWHVRDYKHHLDATNDILEYYSRQLKQHAGNFERIKNKL